MTAVEWLIAELQRLPLEHRLEKAHLFYHAKQMEKEQIMDTYWNGTVDIDKIDALIEAEIFYKETYNK